MGASSSTNQGSASQEQQEQESLAASTGSLPTLRSAFAALSQSHATTTATIPFASLREALSLKIGSFTAESVPVPPRFSQLFDNLGPSIALLFFGGGAAHEGGGGDGIGWVEFLKGFNLCCARAPVSRSINLLYKLYSVMCREAGVSCGLEFDSGEDDDVGSGKVGGALSSSELLDLLWMCWIMGQSSGISVLGQKDVLQLPDVSNLVLSAFVVSDVVADDEVVWDLDLLSMDKTIPAQKVQTWVLGTVPGLVAGLSIYVQERLRACAGLEGGVPSSKSSVDEATSTQKVETCLLTRGRAWAISLMLRDRLSDELLQASLYGVGIENLLYRSSVNGKGLSRFWSNVEGYTGPLMILLSANSPVASGSRSDARQWVIGVLTGEGLENRDTYFGSSGYLCAMSPIFRVCSPSGKERNFIYCHLHPPIRAYEPNPKPVGLAFGGSIGNERIFLDEDFAQITIQHHTVDKTFQHGSLIPNQGFLPVQASVIEVEVWGLGGKAAKEHRDAFKNRENLFSEQRRKVDLKTFGNWEDSPEKMMMDMVSDPNRVRREDR